MEDIDVRRYRRAKNGQHDNENLKQTEVLFGREFRAKSFGNLSGRFLLFFVFRFFVGCRSDVGFFRFVRRSFGRGFCGCGRFDLFGDVLFFFRRTSVLLRGGFFGLRFCDGLGFFDFGRDRKNGFFDDGLRRFFRRDGIVFRRCVFGVEHGRIERSRAYFLRSAFAGFGFFFGRVNFAVGGGHSFEFARGEFGSGEGVFDT